MWFGSILWLKRINSAAVKRGESTGVLGQTREGNENIYQKRRKQRENPVSKTISNIIGFPEIEASELVQMINSPKSPNACLQPVSVLSSDHRAQFDLN